MRPAPPSSTNSFGGVNTGAYYYNAILWAIDEGVTNGTGSGEFSYDNSCTCGPTVTFLYRAI